MANNILGAHGHGDRRNIWVMTSNGMEEITPIEDTTRAARQLARSMGCRYYFRRSAQGDEFGWEAHDAMAISMFQSKWFPTQEAAVMYAAIKGRR